MAGRVKMEYEDAKGGPYINLYVDGKYVEGRPLNPDQELKVSDIGRAVAAVAKALGATVEVEHTQALYDSRGNRIIP
jgi:hypothetical protein